MVTLALGVDRPGCSTLEPQERARKHETADAAPLGTIIRSSDVAGKSAFYCMHNDNRSNLVCHIKIHVDVFGRHKIISASLIVQITT